MSGANRQKRPRKRDASAADRTALCRALKAVGIVRVVIYADKLWLAEMLHAGRSISNPDEDDRAKLEAGTQALIDYLIQEETQGTRY